MIALICSLLLYSAGVAAQAPLRGRVVDALGAPMARVTVTLVNADQDVVTTTLTDAPGAFHFDRDYMEPLGYPAWRRTAHAGLRIRF